jgi:hemerythrin-like domain-containing protein
MTTLSSPVIVSELAGLRAEHRRMAAGAMALRTTADSIGAVPIADLRAAVGDVLSFLDETLLPHAAAEDEVLYPFVGHLLGSPLATATMHRDHAEVLGLTHELSRLHERLCDDGDVVLDDRAANALRRVLYGLFAVITLHLAKEDEIHLPLLETRATTEQVRGVIAGLAAATRSR